MSKNDETQLQMELLAPPQDSSATSRPSAIVVDSYDYRVRAHTERVLDDLRELGLVRGDRRNVK